MKFPSPQYTLLIGQAGLLIALLLAWLWLSEAQASHRDTLENTNRCVQLSDRIETLRGMESVAKLDRNTQSLDNSALVAVAKRSGMHEGQVVSIRRLPPQKLGESDYQRRDVAIELQNVILADLIRFVLELENDGLSRKATSVVLAKSRTRGAAIDAGMPDETWTCELILTQLEYVARSAGR